MRPAQPHRSGFTLLELVISIALVLVLMLAITKIFSITSTTIGASQGISAATRDARAAQTVFQHDIESMASDSPFIWINVEGQRSGTGGMFPGFRNADDAKSDHDGDPLTIDLDDNGRDGDTGVNGERIGSFEVSNRNHRLDQFSFCARDRFTRQTGNSTPNTLISGLTSSEAWIFYGPLALPTNNSSFFINGSTTVKTEPGVGTAETNPNNFYASQWILGRFAPLMISAPTGGISEGTPAIPQEYYSHTTAGSMTPFASGTVSVNTPAAATATLLSGRYDLVDVSIAGAKDIVLNNSSTTVGWWQYIMGNGLATGSDLMEVNPFVIKPINAATASRQVPIFISGCSQFIVEFAGDFCTQVNDSSAANYGKPLAGNPTPDGITDFALSNGQRTIRWYGYPRDTDSTPGISVAVQGNDSDVVTVSDFVLPIGSGYSVLDATVTPHSTTGLVPFEHGTFLTALPAPLTRKTYASGDPTFRYYAAWGPDSVDNITRPRPKMYRITLTIDRPEMAGRSADGQTFQYIFSVP